ncbi:MAG: hypothetical protein WA865_21550 [Spirulinaceae cyanobacterium]
MNYFGILMDFLRNRSQFLDNLDKEAKLEKYTVALLICSSLFFAIYGAIIGSFSGWLQMLASAVKLPALYLLTLIICLPTLYFLDVISGSKRTFNQYLALLLAGMAIISVTLLGLAPVTLFFRISINDYTFFKLWNVAIFIFTGLVGVTFFYRSTIYLGRSEERSPERSKQIIKPWLFLYGLVGSQLGWVLRPFFGSPDRPFQLFREIESNFYLHFWKLIVNTFN